MLHILIRDVSNKHADFLVQQVISSSQHLIRPIALQLLHLDKKLNYGSNFYANACLVDKN